MRIIGATLGRYVGMRFLSAVLLVFGGIFALVALVDYIETMRRANDIPHVSALLVAKTSFYRVPQITERVMPFCVLIGTMVCYLNLSRRLELVVARAAGVSAWQFISPAVIVAFVLGLFATTIYNPLSAIMEEQSKRYEAILFGNSKELLGGGPFWTSQRSADGQAIINAKASRDQGINLTGVTFFIFDKAGHFTRRVDARLATLEPGAWLLRDARVNEPGKQPTSHAVYEVKTNLTPEQARESFATPESVPFWDLPAYITIADHAGLIAAGYKYQFQKLIAQPFLLAAMVFLAASVSLRLFRFGGVQKMILSGVAAGFLLYVLSKVTEDMTKAELMHPVPAAWLPVLAGGLTGFIALLYQEDG